MPFNPKRRLAADPGPDVPADLAARVRYGGNPEHKHDPGDFELTPPSRPRADKPKYDQAGITERAVAFGISQPFLLSERLIVAIQWTYSGLAGIAVYGADSWLLQMAIMYAPLHLHEALPAVSSRP